jgi:hypothetical protein
MFRICILLTLGFAASQTILPAQQRNRLEGIWSVSVNDRHLTGRLTHSPE